MVLKRTFSAYQSDGNKRRESATPRSKLQKTMDDFEYGYKNTTDLPPLSVNDNKDKNIISYACYMYRNEKPWSGR